MKKTVLGVLAHVDAGKTTLSEAMLYISGNLRELGRVDKGNAFLDTHSLERSRGITIFSKQAKISCPDMELTLLDTPGHVDFSAETERTLQVLDYAILVISGTDGVQAHTKTLWNLLSKYQIPVFLFINKMDQPGADQGKRIEELKRKLSESCVNFSQLQNECFYEEVALCEEQALEEYLEEGSISDERIQGNIQKRKIFPCFFGSALKLEGIQEFLQGLNQFTKDKAYPKEFSAKVYKITRDDQGNRLTFMKITGGELKVRSNIAKLEEKINQIRIYSGEKYITVSDISAGNVCAVTGLKTTQAGMNLGEETKSMTPILEPVLTYRILWPQEEDVHSILSKFRMLEEEEPQLNVVWNEELQELHAKLMGNVQLEIITSLMLERFGIEIQFLEGSIVYKETIQNTVEGIGHFEPLRHYAEVHLLISPLEAGSGLQLETLVSEDELDKSWQKLILSHLAEKEHRGVLTGAPVTDLKITLAAAKAHKKHTEGGDFRQAVYRALRQGLKQAESILLEPWYTFELEVPAENVGRAMNDIERMKGNFVLSDTQNGTVLLSGHAPVYTLQNYQEELIAYTKGKGRLSVAVEGYIPCHNSDEIIEKSGYDSEKDIENTADSVFCAHGAGFVVKWNQVWEYMHLPRVLALPKSVEFEQRKLNAIANKSFRTDDFIATAEVDAILEKTSFANAGSKTIPYRKSAPARKSSYSDTVQTIVRQPKLIKYLLVDGYNIVFAWEELKELAKVTIDGARGKLMDILCNYQSIVQLEIIVVFDAYRVENHREEMFDYHNIHVVYTAFAETADRYIERFAHNNKGKYDIMVATSDYMEQIITRGQGCNLLSASELEVEVKRVNEKNLEDYVNQQIHSRNYLKESIPKDILNIQT